MTGPGHPVTVTGLITDYGGRLLVLRPARADHPWWFLPGAPLPFGKEPVTYLRVALAAQLNLKLEVGALHLTAYRWSAHQRDIGEFVLLFDLGTHNSEALTAAGLWPGRTVQLYRWATAAEAAIHLEPAEWQRVAHALRHPRSGAFLEQPRPDAPLEPGDAHDADVVSGRVGASTGPQQG